jgi:hypothetical protein
MAKDIFHPHVRRALEKDGWTVTHDPLLLPWGSAPVQVDLGAEKIIAVEKGQQKIAVEVKSFFARLAHRGFGRRAGADRALPLFAPSRRGQAGTVFGNSQGRLRKLHLPAACH